MTAARFAAVLPILVALAGCGFDPGGNAGRVVGPTRVDPVRLGAPPTLDPGITRRVGPYIRPSGPYIGRPVYRTPPF